MEKMDKDLESQNFASADDDDFGTFEFSDRSIRMGFIRKVYSILLCQLSVSIAFICLFLYQEDVKRYCSSSEGQWMFWTAFALTIVCIIAMACCGDVRRKFPINFIFLGVFTLCESFLLGLAASTYDADAVLMAVGITAGVTLALTLFAFQTKWDFTMMGGLLFVFLIVLMLFGFLCLFIQNNYVQIVYAALGALLFSAYIVFDTQIMLGGKHKFAISPEEYIFAALNLYLDIINLFLFLLDIISRAK